MDNNCIACHNTNPYPLTSTDRISRETFKILCCPECHTAWLDHSPDFDPSRYYPEINTGERGYRFKGILELTVNLFRRARSNFILRFWKDKPGNILDIGCGRGKMLFDLLSRGWDCTGTEMFDNKSIHIKDPGTPKIIVAPNLEDCRFPTDHFDIITMWHVFEHLPQPTKVLTEIRRILKPGGLLIIEVPNSESVQAKINLTQWIYLEVPRHFYQFSYSGILRLLKDNSFKKEYSGTFSLEFGIFGMWQSLLNIITPQKNLLFALLNQSERRIVYSLIRSNVVGLILLAIFGLPCLAIAIPMEFISAAVNRGSVVRIVLTNVK